MDEQAKTQHLSPAAVDEYFQLGVPSAFNLHESPPARLVIDPVENKVKLLTPARGPEPDVTQYERLSIRRLKHGFPKSDWYELVVDASEMHYEAYVLVESIVDQLRAGASVQYAVSDSLQSLEELIANRERLSEEKVTGLIGELLVLNQIIEHDGKGAAIAAWLGPLAGEHDFGLPKFDVEVKTTRSEARIHVIGSESQLEAVPGRPLYLISIQITHAGAADGFSLGSLITQTRSNAAEHQYEVDTALSGLGWRDADADLYKTRFQLRSTPRAYLVDDEFPAITRPRLDHVPNRSFVVDVSYRLDVTNFKLDAIPAPLDKYCEVPS